jgi:hypothetical protein
MLSPLGLAHSARSATLCGEPKEVATGAPSSAGTAVPEKPPAARQPTGTVERWLIGVLAHRFISFEAAAILPATTT